MLIYVLAELAWVLGCVNLAFVFGALPLVLKIHYDIKNNK